MILLQCDFVFRFHVFGDKCEFIPFMRFNFIILFTRSLVYLWDKLSEIIMFLLSVRNPLPNRVCVSKSNEQVLLVLKKINDIKR